MAANKATSAWRAQMAVRSLRLLCALSVGVVRFVAEGRDAFAQEAAYGPVALMFEATCKGRGKGQTKIEIKPEHRVDSAAAGAAVIADLLAKKGCTATAEASRIAMMTGEMAVTDFHGSLYAAAAISAHLERFMDGEKVASMIGTVACGDVLQRAGSTQVRSVQAERERIHAASLGLARLWPSATKSERMMLNGEILKVSAAFVRCSANRTETPPVEIGNDVMKIMDASAAFHKAVLGFMESKAKAK